MHKSYYEFIFAKYILDYEIKSVAKKINIHIVQNLRRIEVG